MGRYNGLVEINIEKLIYGGDGLGRLPADENGRGKAVFVPFVLEGERVEIELVEQRPGFARARLGRVLESSPLRTVPPCPYFGQCGGCHYQHTSYENQVKIKSTILQETLQRTAKLTLDRPLVVHAAEPWQYRNRTRLKVRTLPAFALGYFRHGTHDLLPVEECPISSPLINHALDLTLQVASAAKVPSTLREVQFFANHDDSQLLVEIYADRGTDPAALRPLAEALHAALPAIAGVAVIESIRGNDDEIGGPPQASSRSSAPATIFGADSIMYTVAGREYRVGAGAFFQTNRFLIDDLVSTVVGGTHGSSALDLYAGTGLFSVPLAASFERVIAVEAAPASYADLKRNAPRNAKAIKAPTEHYLLDSAGRARFDLVVVDPPRSGLGEKNAGALGRMHVPRVTYVSCDPSTLSRDLRVLLESGFRVQEAHLFDLFPQTYHMESVFHLVR